MRFEQVENYMYYSCDLTDKKARRKEEVSRRRSNHHSWLKVAMRRYFRRMAKMIEPEDRPERLGYHGSEF